MAVTKRAKPTEAPNAKPKRWQRGNKTQITVTIAPELVEQLDAEAERWHMSRSALLTMWVVERLAKVAA
jgi:hypothetical protein